MPKNVFNYLNNCTTWYYRPFFDYNNTILNGIGAVVAVFKRFAAIDLHIIPDIGVFVDDRITDMASVADAHNWRFAEMRFFDLLERLIIIRTHYITTFNNGPKTYTCTDANDRTADMTRVNDTSIRNYSLINLGARHFGGWQHARPCIDVIFAKKIKLRDIIS